MATKYLQEYASEADFLADAVDAPSRVGFGAVSEIVVINKGGSVVEVVDETATQTLQNKTIIAKTLTPTEATVLTAADSDSIIFLNAAAGFDITLPAVAAGLRFKFIMGALSATTNFRVVSPAATIIYGGAVVNSTFVVADQETYINFVVSAEKIGDWVEVICDGTNWLVNGNAEGAGAITFTTS